MAPGPIIRVKMPEKHDLALVTVLRTNDTFALALAKSALEDAGICYIVSGDDPGLLFGVAGNFGASGIGQTPLWNSSSEIQVARESEAEARALLEPLQNPPMAADRGAEPKQDS